MTGRIADAKEDRLVFPSRLLEGLLAPGIPVYWIELVLQQVRGFLVCQAIGVGMGRFRGFGFHSLVDIRLMACRCAAQPINQNQG